MSVATSKHLDMHDYARDMIRAHRNDAWLTAKLLARQAARENWTQEAVYEARDAFTWDAMVLFDKEYAKFRMDSRYATAAGYSTSAGFYGNGFNKAGEGVMVVENFKRGTRPSGPVFDSLKMWAITDRLTPRVNDRAVGQYESPDASDFEAYVIPEVEDNYFTLCENENCRANCCK